MSKTTTSRFILVVALFTVGLFILLRPQPFDEGRFNDTLQQIQANDLLATSIFNVPESVDRAEYAQTARGGIELYESNIELLNELQALPSIPADKLELTKDIEQYSELRLEQFELLARSAEEDTQKYFPDINNLADRIQNLDIYQQGSIFESIETSTEAL